MICVTVTRCYGSWPDCTGPWMLDDPSSNVADHRTRHYATRALARAAAKEANDFADHFALGALWTRSIGEAEEAAEDDEPDGPPMLDDDASAYLFQELAKQVNDRVLHLLFPPTKEGEAV